MVYNLAERLREAIYDIANNLVPLKKGQMEEDPAVVAQIETYNKVLEMITALSRPLPVPDYNIMAIPDLAAELQALKNELDELGDMKSEVQKRYDFLSIEVVPDRMDDEGIESIRVAGVGRLQTQSDIRCNVPAANREAVQDWLKNNGHGSMVTESINSSSLKAFVKEMMREDQPYPKELLQIHPYSRATVVKV